MRPPPAIDRTLNLDDAAFDLVRIDSAEKTARIQPPVGRYFQSHVGFHFYRCRGS